MMNICSALKVSLPLFLAGILALFLCLPHVSDAHKINVFAWLDGDQVHVALLHQIFKGVICAGKGS